MWDGFQAHANYGTWSIDFDSNSKETRSEDLFYRDKKYII